MHMAARRRMTSEEGAPGPADDRSAERAAAALQLEQLAEKYRRAALDRVVALQQLIAALRVSPQAQPLRAQARLLAHSMRGTAATYGLAGVGAAAGRVEDALLSSVEPIDWRVVDAALQSAHELAKQAASDGDDGSVHAFAPPMDAARSNTEGGPARDRPAQRRALFIGAADSSLLADVQRTAAVLMVAVDVAPDPDSAARLDAANPADLFIVDAEAVGGASAVLTGCQWFAGRPLIVGSREHTMDARVLAAHAGASTVLHLPAPSSVVTEALHLALAPKQAGRPRVVVLDDDPAFLDVVAALLSGEGVELQQMRVADDLAAILDAPPPELLILDVVMPQVSGLDVCRVLRATAGWREVPVFFVSADTRSETRMASFRAGGDDFIAKPVLAEELLVKLRVALERVRLRRDLTERDTLTGLLLRRPLIEQLNQRIAMGRRRSQLLSIAMLDLDHFKQINDVRGHLAGDRVLATVGQLLRERFRLEDVRGRWGGEELLLGLANVTATEAARVIARTLDELRAMSFTADDGATFHVSFSAGVASFPDDGDALEQLLKVADRRLYAAKSAGRCRVIHVG